MDEEREVDFIDALGCDLIPAAHRAALRNVSRWNLVTCTRQQKRHFTAAGEVESGVAMKQMYG